MSSGDVFHYVLWNQDHKLRYEALEISEEGKTKKRRGKIPFYMFRTKPVLLCSYVVSYLAVIGKLNTCEENTLEIILRH